MLPAARLTTPPFIIKSAIIHMHPPINVPVLKMVPMNTCRFSTFATFTSLGVPGVDTVGSGTSGISVGTGITFEVRTLPFGGVTEVLKTSVFVVVVLVAPVVAPLGAASLVMTLVGRGTGLTEVRVGAVAGVGVGVGSGVTTIGSSTVLIGATLSGAVAAKLIGNCNNRPMMMSCDIERSFFIN